MNGYYKKPHLKIHTVTHSTSHDLYHILNSRKLTIAIYCWGVRYGNKRLYDILTIGWKDC